MCFSSESQWKENRQFFKIHSSHSVEWDFLQRHRRLIFSWNKMKTDDRTDTRRILTQPASHLEPQRVSGVLSPGSEEETPLPRTSPLGSCPHSCPSWVSLSRPQLDHFDDSIIFLILKIVCTLPKKDLEGGWQCTATHPDTQGSETPILGAP